MDGLVCKLLFVCVCVGGVDLSVNKNSAFFFLPSNSFCVLGERPFMCETCGKSFASKEYLKHHNRIHTGSKPFKCEVCFRTFAQRNSLYQHIKVHTGRKLQKQLRKMFGFKKKLENLRESIDANLLAALSFIRWWEHLLQFPGFHSAVCQITRVSCVSGWIHNYTELYRNVLGFCPASHSDL